MNNPLRSWSIVIGIFAFLIFGIIQFNIWITRQVSQVTADKKADTPAPPAVAEKPKPSGAVSRRTLLDPSREFSINIFTQGGEEVARFHSRGFEVWDVAGRIPDGKVVFNDEARQTHGEEYYLDNKREGFYREFYDNEQLRFEVVFDNGKIMAIKEYYYDGTPRMEADYRDAMFSTDEPETGEGKVYFRDGKIMYEWSITNLDDNRYKLSYDIYGKKTEKRTYDNTGKLVEIIDYRKERNLAP